MSKRAKIMQLLEESPDDVFLNYSLAMELTKDGTLAEARAQFARVRSLDLGYVPAYFQEAQFLAGRGEVEAARQIVREGIQVARDTGDDHALGEMTEFLESIVK